MWPFKNNLYIIIIPAPGNYYKTLTIRFWYDDKNIVLKRAQKKFKITL